MARNEDSGPASRLFLIDFDDVVVLHFQSLGRVIVIDSLSVEEEAKSRDRDSLTFTVALLQLAHGRGELDFEMDFGIVLSHDLEANVLGRFVSVLVGAVVTHLLDLVRVFGFGNKISPCLGRLF